MVHRRTHRLFFALGFIGIVSLAFAPLVWADIPQLVPNTAVLLANTSGGGNGGNTSSASNATNIFAPASYVDYHSLGGEPTTVVDRYPFAPGQTVGSVTCPPTSLTPCAPRDIVYVSNPLGVGFPGYSQFYKSMDGGQTFRVPFHNPFFFNEPTGTEASGGGDSHQAVGQTTHSVFFVDLSGACVTMNISRDLGETFSSNKLGCEANPGAIDDRQWVATDETLGSPPCTTVGPVTTPAVCGGNVYMNVNNDTGCLATSQPGCAIVFVKSTDDGGANTPADFAAAPCNDATAFSFPGLATLAPSACPDPNDPDFWIAGPITVDTSTSSPNQHSLYIPFERNVGGNNFQLWVAISRDQGDSWTRQKVADLGPHDAANIFPELTIDTAGNLYYTWSQAQTIDANTPSNEGETDAYYTYSTDAGATWQTPIDITKETGDSAVFPWMVAGSPGQVDLVMYKANTGLNPNVGFLDTNGNPNDANCSAVGSNCIANTTVWNTYFGQSQNALNTGANFKLVQISDHPIHTGGVCTQGIACQSGAQQNRDLLDFLTIDYDHTGAAYTTWADDNNSQHDTRQFFSRQLAGASILTGQNIAAMNSYPITNHAVTDPAGDVYDAAGLPVPASSTTCPPGSGMDILGTSASRTDSTLTVTMTLDGPPTAAHAILCSGAATTGGLWGAEFWAAAPAGPVPANTTEQSNTYGNGNFYIAYRDNSGNTATPTPGVEAGFINSISPTFTHDEFHKYEDGAPVGGTCFSTPAPPLGTPCTVVMTVSLSGLGIKSGSILASVSGFSVYYFGSESQPPGFRIPLGNSNLADTATPFDVNGTGTTQ
jgi:hypothetical protein